jgi:hypothetical protein
MSSIINEIPNEALINMKLQAYLCQTSNKKDENGKSIVYQISPTGYEVVIDHINDEDNNMGFNIFINDDTYGAIHDIDLIRICDEFDNLIFAIYLKYKFDFVMIKNIGCLNTILDFNITKCDLFAVSDYKTIYTETAEIIRFDGRCLLKK